MGLEINVFLSLALICAQDCKQICIRETLSLLTCADSNTNTKTDSVSHVTCQVSGVTCCMSHITYHLLLTPTATATDPPPVHSPIKHIMLVCKDQKTRKHFKEQFFFKMAKTQQKTEVCQYQRYALQPGVSSQPGNGVSVMAQTRLTDIATQRLNQPSGPIQ